MDYLPSLLLRYLEEAPPHPYSAYEYQVLFGYIHWAERHAALELYKPTSLVPHPRDAEPVAKGSSLRGYYLPPFIKGATVTGIYSSRQVHCITYMENPNTDIGYQIPYTFEAVRQFFAYLISYDAKFCLKTLVDKILRHRGSDYYFLQVARVAASVGNMPLTLDILNNWIVHKPDYFLTVLALLLPASIDKTFFDKLRTHCPRATLDGVNLYAVIEELIYRDDPERVSWYLPKIKGTELIPILLRSKAERIKTFLVASGFSDSI